MPKVAIVHDFLFQYGGAEKVVEKLLDMYPQADLYTSFFVPERFISSVQISKAAQEGRLKTTWLDKFLNFTWKSAKDSDLTARKPFLRLQKHLFWLYPLLMRFVRLRDYDLVIINSTDCAKQVIID